jgi:hypothetical protein
MLVRKCKCCGAPVEVQSSRATVVTCSKCKEEKWGIGVSRDQDTDNFVFCRLCKHSSKVLIKHIKDKHGLTQEQYCKLFPDALLIAKNTTIKKRSRTLESRAKTSVKSRAAWEREEYKARQIERLKQKRSCWKMSAEGIENIKTGQNNSEKMKLRRSRIEINKARREQVIREKKEKLQYFVLCPLCLSQGKDEIDSRYEFLTYKHLQVHGYSLEQFYKDFLGYGFKIERLSKEHSDCLSGEKHFNYGKHLSVQTKENISRSVIDSWDDHNETKICLKCNNRMMLRNTNDVCNECLCIS